jgi:ribosome recycling factor
MEKKIFAEAEEHMKKSLESLRAEFAGIRTGKATPSLLDTLRVTAYGAQVPLNQVASVTSPEARLLLIQPWDKSLIGEIEKAIQKSDLGLNPSSDGHVLRLPIPPLTEERRKDLVKVTKKMAEEARVATRNIRRDANEAIKKLLKEGKVSEDEDKQAHDQTQKLTDRYIALVDELLAKKEKEIMEV